jgi:two-component system sensor histidine kinase MprB
MSLRRRLGLVAAAAVGVAVVLAAVVCYVEVRGQLSGQVDDALRGQALLVERFGQGGLDIANIPGLPASAGGGAPITQIVATDGTILRSPPSGITLPVDSTITAIAGGRTSSTLADVNVGGLHLRVFTFTAPHGVLFNGQLVPAAIELARPLTPVDHILSHLRLILLLLCAGGMALAAALGRLAARRVLAPLSEVAQTAQEIGETDDLSRRLAIHADDEVGQLADRFNTMLERLESSRAALDESVRAQRQLVADASHELRTPVTSLRTNIEVLLAGGELNDDDRRRLLNDVVEQSEELSALVGDLIELARGDQPIGSAEDVRLDGIVEESVEWARRNSSNVDFKTDLQPVIVEGVPERLARAINNLLDNAARHSPHRGTVEVTVDRDGVRVRDHGSGVEEQDLPYVFDRFFRGANSRDRQGSGLGLAIVRQVAEQHGGSATAGNAPDGGAVFALHLPTYSPDAADSSGQPIPPEPANVP